MREQVEHEPVAELGHAQDLAQLVPHVLPRGHDVRAQVAVPQRPGKLCIFCIGSESILCTRELIPCATLPKSKILRALYR